jgi:hypothetical protein
MTIRRAFFLLALAFASILFSSVRAHTADITDEPYIGLDIAPDYNTDGTPAVVTRVHPGSQAEAAGIEAGDVFKSILLITDSKNNIAQPSRRERGIVPPDFLNPTTEDVLAILQHGRDIEAWSTSILLYRPSFQSNFTVYLAYPKGYFSSSTALTPDAQKRWLTEHSSGLQSARRPRQPTRPIITLPRLEHAPMSYLTQGLLFGLGVIIALLIYARRATIINLLIHHRLPYTLPVYPENITVLFKRTQRANWYGRTIFGIVTKLTVSEQQLASVRKYWLGRVIAFDSLRRQRQNELALLHLQLAATAQTEARNKKPLSKLWTAIKYVFTVLFYVIRAAISFLIGFLFIRVTIAKLVRGTVIESSDLTLVLQAKEAVEQTAQFLKEYLTTADTFDGKDEIYVPE